MHDVTYLFVQQAIRNAIAYTIEENPKQWHTCPQNRWPFTTTYINFVEPCKDVKDSAIICSVFIQHYWLQDSSIDSLIPKLRSTCMEDRIEASKLLRAVFLGKLFKSFVQ
jgi:hypothetical protein